MSNTDTLRAEAEYLAACLRDMSTRAETRSFTPEEDAEFLAGRALYDEKVQILERHAEIARLAEIPANVENGDGALNAPNVIVRDDPFDLTEVRYGDSEGLQSKALAVIEKVDGLEDRHRAQASHLVRSLDSSVALRIVATSSEAYRSGWMKAAYGRPEILTPKESEALARAVTLGGTGGYPVPTVLDPTIIDTGVHSSNPFRQLATVKQITGTTWNGVSSAGVTASWDGELVEVSDDAPTLAQLSIPVFKGQAFVPFSVESEDWLGMEADVRRMIAVAKDDLEGAAFVSGNGTTAPQGIATALDGTTREIAPTTAETFALADIGKLESSVEPRYRANAAFVANKVWYNAIRAFETNIPVGSILARGTGNGPGQFDLTGYPAYESTDMDAVLPNAAASADNFGLFFGDFKQGYYIIDRVGLTVELVPHLFHVTTNRPSGARGFLAWWRTGAEVVNANALAMLSIPTTA